MQPVPMVEPSGDRQTLLMLGMHRSGTSALTHLISTMGVHVGDPDELLPTDAEQNPTGFWERVDFVREHEGFLQKHGFDWGKLAGYSLDGIAADGVKELRRNLGAICARIDSHGRPLLIKDPRLCLLLPVWHTITPNPVHIFAVRDPRKVAASLLKAYYGTFTAHFVLALWQKYIQTALSALHGRRVLFVAYARMLEQSQAECARILAGLSELGIGGLRGIEQSELSALLDPKLDRSATPPHVRLSPTQSDLRDWLNRQCAVPGPVAILDLPPFEAPDEVLRELEQVREESLRRGLVMAAQRGRTLVSR